MNDEKYSFVRDVIEKKSTARSARNRRTHNGKGGRVRFPSDNLSKKELVQMSGEVKSYRLNEPMTWEYFKSMPEDIQSNYIRLLREKFDVPDKELANMFGVSKDVISRYFKASGLNHDVNRNTRRKWNTEGWLSFVHSVPVSAPQVEDGLSADASESIQYAVENVEDECICENENTADTCDVKHIVPKEGSLRFCGSADEALRTVSSLLCGANVTLRIEWITEEESF